MAFVRQLSQAKWYTPAIAVSRHGGGRLAAAAAAAAGNKHTFFSTDVSESLKDPSKRQFMRKKYMNCMTTLDTNKDGLIKRSDIVHIAKDHKSMGLPEDGYRKLVNEYERISDSLGLTDYSKELPLTEATENWIKYLQTTKLDTTLEKTRFRIMFNNVDINRDGEITFDEWIRHCKAYGVTEHAQASFKAMDTNGDGKISQEEFSAYLYEFFYTTDNKLYSAILYGPVDQSE